jgi:peptidoglycan/LPS O-acetylase OafA/YrhL
LLTALERRIYRNRAVCLAAVSQRTASLLKEYFDRGDARVIPNGVDTVHFSAAARRARRAESRRARGFGDDDFVLLLIGNDWRVKGLSTILEAMAALPGTPSRLIVAGSDDSEPFISQAVKLGLQERCRWEHAKADVLDFYAAADVYVSPSREDSFGLPVAEAMACGLPVVSSVFAGVSEIIRDGVDGFVLQDPRDPQILARLLRVFYADGNLRDRIGEAAERTAREWSWDRNAEAVWKLLSDLSVRGRGSRVQHPKPSELRPGISGIAAHLWSSPSMTSTGSALPSLTHHRRALPALTGIRFLAAFYVVLFHGLPWLRQKFVLPQALQTFLANGYLAVDLFFILSGFILAYTYEGQIEGKTNRLHFWEARFARIYPVYVLSLFLAFWFERGLALGTRLAVLGMVQAWNPRAPALTGAWNYPAWTLSVEAFFYLCFPFVLPWMSRQSIRTLLWTMGALLALCIGLRAPIQGIGDWNRALPFMTVVPLPLLRMPEFLLGMAIGLRVLGYERTGRNSGSSLRAGVAVVCALVILSLPLGAWVSLVAIPFAVLVYELATGESLLAKFLSTKAMVLLGGASYAVYLLQFPVRSWTRVIFSHFPEKFARLGSPLTPLILVLVSIVVFKLWEEPSRRTLRSWFARGKSHPA